ncbi:hypothetical protein C8U37_11179 [Trichococcus patagoniensis]|uniref:Uncharacterized protein n=1 Tax=Trichococcus patagoniensis TaxID=382641 RepID=A0A2T5IJI5_9LACT|nr:hypothetical protein C8U37_11179 [Trichococcus patagoniensis]
MIKSNEPSFSGERRLRRSSGCIPFAFSDESGFIGVQSDCYRCAPVSRPFTGDGDVLHTLLLSAGAK